MKTLYDFGLELKSRKPRVGYQIYPLKIVKVIFFFVLKQRKMVWKFKIKYSWQKTHFTFFFQNKFILVHIKLHIKDKKWQNIYNKMMFTDYSNILKYAEFNSISCKT